MKNSAFEPRHTAFHWQDELKGALDSVGGTPLCRYIDVIDTMN